MGKCLSFLVNRPYRSDAYADILALLWAKHNSSTFCPLSINILREVNSYLSCFGLLAHLQGGSLRFFSVRTNSWSPELLLKKRINVDSYSSAWVLLDSYSVFVCGGTPCKV